MYRYVDKIECLEEKKRTAVEQEDFKYVGLRSTMADDDDDDLDSENSALEQTITGTDAYYEEGDERSSTCW